MKNLEKEINNIKSLALENYVPIVRDKTLAFICDILKEENCQNILEIGTAVGYSGINMLLSCNARLTTIEKDENRFNEAKKNFEKLGLTYRVTQILDDALNALVKFQNSTIKFDFIFLDGPKGQYIKYLPLLKNILKGGGTLFADNVMLGGLVEDEAKVTHKNRAMVQNMKTFNHQLLSDDDFESTLYRVDDGFIVAKYK